MKRLCILDSEIDKEYDAGTNAERKLSLEERA